MKSLVVFGAMALALTSNLAWAEGAKADYTKIWADRCQMSVEEWKKLPKAEKAAKRAEFNAAREKKQADWVKKNFDMTLEQWKALSREEQTAKKEELKKKREAAKAAKAAKKAAK